VIAITAASVSFFLFCVAQGFNKSGYCKATLGCESKLLHFAWKADVSAPGGHDAQLLFLPEQMKTDLLRQFDGYGGMLCEDIVQGRSKRLDHAEKIIDKASKCQV